jgi:hypothetical protein
VPRSALGPLQHLGEPADADRRVESRRVDLRDVGSEQRVDAEPGGDHRIALLAARVAGEIRRLLELRRVDEERDDHVVAVLARRAHQRLMAAVKGAHRRHQRDAAARSAGGRDVRANLGDRAQRPHRAALASARVASASAS